MKRDKACKCDHNCFHCPYPDCICSARIITPWESDVMHGAHGGWELENNAMLYGRMKRAGMDAHQIVLGLRIPSSGLGAVKRKAARIGKRGTAV